MNNPITPPPELVQQWWDAIPNDSTTFQLELATRSAQWGADDQLKKVEEYLEQNAMMHAFEIDEFHEVMRPSPKQTLEQIALLMLDTIEASKQFTPEITDTIRRAIKALPE